MKPARDDVRAAPSASSAGGKNPVMYANTSITQGSPHHHCSGMGVTMFESNARSIANHLIVRNRYKKGSLSF
jgi:hypothetical protein